MANTAMANIKLPQPMRQDIREYFKKIMITMTSQKELEDFQKTISPSLALRFRSHMFQNVLKNNNRIIKKTQEQIIAADEQGADSKDSKEETAVAPLKGAVPLTPAQKRAQHLLDTIVINLETSLNIPDEDVIRQDDYIEEKLCMYYVGTGHCRVQVRDHNGKI